MDIERVFFRKVVSLLLGQDGQYYNTTTGQVETTYLVPFDSDGKSYRVYELFEFYPELWVHKLEKDTSWMTEGSLQGNGQVK